MDKNDQMESDPSKYTKEEIQEKIAKLRERKERHEDFLKEMKETKETQKSFVDPESRLMKVANGGFDVCYNAQIIVDPKSHIVGTVEITNNCNDLGQLSPVTETLKEDLGVDVMDVTADKGFADKVDMLRCLMNGTIPHVSLKDGQKSHELELDYKEAVVTEEILNSTKSKDIKTCLESGILPKVYEGKGIKISVYEVDQCTMDGNNQSSFTLNKDGLSVICPNGKTLNKVSRLRSKGKTRFASKSACKNCEDKCTTSKFKQVDMNDGQREVKVKRFQKVKKVGISLTPDKEKIKNRKCVVEHPFGTVKRWNDGSYTLLTGKEKVGADLSLLFLAYNIKRVINILGIPEMLKKMKEMREIITGNFSFFFNIRKYCPCD
jgi:transposase